MYTDFQLLAVNMAALQYIHGVFDSGLREIQVCGQVLRDLMATHLPAIYEKFEKENMEPVLYMVDWFMVCSLAYSTTTQHFAL